MLKVKSAVGAGVFETVILKSLVYAEAPQAFTARTFTVAAPAVLSANVFNAVLVEVVAVILPLTTHS